MIGGGSMADAKRKVMLRSETFAQRDYDEAELAACKQILANVEDPGRQVTPSSAGQAYRDRLRSDIAALEERLASEDA